MSDLPDTLQEIWGKQEDLHPELQACFCMEGKIPVIKHPLIFSIFHVPQMNTMINRGYEQKSAAAKQSREAGDFMRFVIMHERPYRVFAMQQVKRDEKMTFPLWIDLLSFVWQDSENIWQNKGFWQREFAEMARRGDYAENLMDDEDRQAWRALAYPVTLYRGCVVGRSERGLSWTLNRKKAEWFASRLCSKKQRMVLLEVQRIEQRDTLAYFGGRNEAEVLLHPSVARNRKLIRRELRT